MATAVDSLAKGGVAGFAATGPMTLFIELMHPALPERDRDPLPPRHITANAAEAAGVRHHLDGPDEQRLAMLAHFGFGTTAGALYGPLAQALRPHPIAGGVGYGLAVWLASYLGWLPAAGLYRSAAEDAPSRNALMIAAHVLWGATLGCTLAELDGPPRRARAPIPAPPPEVAATVGG